VRIRSIFAGALPGGGRRRGPRRLASLAVALLATALAGLATAGQANALVPGGGTPPPPPSHSLPWVLVNSQTGGCLESPFTYSGAYIYQVACTWSGSNQAFSSGWGPHAGTVHIVSAGSGLCVVPTPPNNLGLVVQSPCTDEPRFDWQWVASDSYWGQWYSPYYNGCLSIEAGYDITAIGACYSATTYWHRVGG
jgi:hypothetical protein